MTHAAWWIIAIKRTLFLRDAPARAQTTFQRVRPGEAARQRHRRRQLVGRQPLQRSTPARLDRREARVSSDIPARMLSLSMMPHLTVPLTPAGWHSSMARYVKLVAT